MQTTWILIKEIQHTQHFVFISHIYRWKSYSEWCDTILLFALFWCYVSCGCRCICVCVISKYFYITFFIKNLNKPWKRLPWYDGTSEAEAIVRQTYIHTFAKVDHLKVDGLNNIHSLQNHFFAPSTESNTFRVQAGENHFRQHCSNDKIKRMNSAFEQETEMEERERKRWQETKHCTCELCWKWNHMFFICI